MKEFKVKPDYHEVVFQRESGPFTLWGSGKLIRSEFLGIFCQGWKFIKYFGRNCPCQKDSKGSPII